MSKRNPYQMRKSTEARLRREIRNFNQRRDRFIKNHPELADIQPPRIKPSQTLKELGSTADVKAFEKALKSYTAETARPADTGEGGVNVSKWELAKVKREVKRVNAKAAARKAKERKVFINGQEVMNAEKMGRKLKDKAPVKVDVKKSQEDWKKFKDFYEKESTDYNEKVRKPEVHKEKLKSAYYSGGPADPVLWQLYEVLPAPTLLQMYYDHSDAANPRFIYTESIDDSDKVKVIKIELGAEIKKAGLENEVLDKMAGASGYDSPELRELWDEIGAKEVFDLYLDGENIFDIDFLYEQIDHGDEDESNENEGE